MKSKHAENVTGKKCCRGAEAGLLQHRGKLAPMETWRMASGGHGFDFVLVLSMDCAPQHHWFNIVYVVSASGGKRLNLRLYAVLKQALGLYCQSSQQLEADSWWCCCGEEESGHLLCDFSVLSCPSSWGPHPATQFAPCHQVTLAHTCFLVIRVSMCFPVHAEVI